MPFEFVPLTPSSYPYGIKRTSLVPQAAASGRIVGHPETVGLQEKAGDLSHPHARDSLSRMYPEI
jgi:hypothetical protein